MVTTVTIYNWTKGRTDGQMRQWDNLKTQLPWPTLSDGTGKQSAQQHSPASSQIQYLIHNSIYHNSRNVM